MQVILLKMILQREMLFWRTTGVSGFSFVVSTKDVVLVSISIAVIKHRDQKPFREGLFRLHFPGHNPSREKMARIQGRSLESAIVAKPCRNPFTSSFLIAFSACIFILSGPSAWFTTLNNLLTFILIINEENSLQTCLLANLREALFQLRSFFTVARKTGRKTADLPLFQPVKSNPPVSCPVMQQNTFCSLPSLISSGFHTFPS